MLQVKNLSFRYGMRSSPALDHVEMTLDDGQIGIVLGKNGSGKTTLFKNLLGIRKPCGGSALLDGRDLFQMSRKERARKIAYVPQDIQFGALSVYDSILIGRISYFGLRAGAEDHRAVERVLNDMGLEEHAHKNVEKLSGGERQKVAIARALTQDPDLLIFDEPTGNLDLANEHLIMEEAKKAARNRNISILCSLHDLNQALEFGDKFFLLKHGSLPYAGGKDLLNEEVIRDIFDMEVEVLEVKNRKIIFPARTRRKSS